MTLHWCPRQLNLGDRTTSPFVDGRPANPLKCKGAIIQSDSRPGGAPICVGSRRVLIMLNIFSLRLATADTVPLSAGGFCRAPIATIPLAQFASFGDEMTSRAESSRSVVLRSRTGQQFTDRVHLAAQRASATVPNFCEEIRRHPKPTMRSFPRGEDLVARLNLLLCNL